MATEAELRIRPKMVGEAAADLDQARSSMRALGRTQKQELRQGRRQVGKLERAYEGLRGGVNRVKRGLGGVANRVFSIQSAIAGTLAFGAGRTFLEATLGSADEMDRAQKQMGEIFDDAEAALERSSELTGEVASLSMGDAVQGMQSLGVVAEGSADQAGELVKLGKALEQIRPEQGFEGASLAIKELASGQTRSLVQRFDMPREVFPDRDEAKRIAKQQGKTLQGVYLGVLRDFIEEERGGVERLLEIDRQSLRGNLQMLETAGRDLLREVGEQALPEVTASVKTAANELRALRDDPAFREAAEDFGAFMGDAAESVADMAPALIRGIPTAAKTVTDTIRTAKRFYDSHPTLVKVAGGMFAANALTGGGLTALGGNLLGRAVSGGGGGITGGLAGGGKCCEGIDQAADTLDDVTSTASGGASRGFLQKTLFSAGSTSAAASFTEATMAAITPSAVGSLAAGVAPFAVGALGLQQLESANKGPRQEVENPIDTSDFSSNAIAAMGRGEHARAKKLIMRSLGATGPGDRFQGTKAQRMQLDQTRATLAAAGLSVDLDKGQKFRNLDLEATDGFKDRSWAPFTSGGATKEDLQRARGVEQTRVENLNINMQPTGDPEEDGRRAGKAAKSKLEEKIRKRKSKE